MTGLLGSGEGSQPGDPQQTRPTYANYQPHHCSLIGPDRMARLWPCAWVPNQNKAQPADQNTGCV